MTQISKSIICGFCKKKIEGNKLEINHKHNREFCSKDCFEYFTLCLSNYGDNVSEEIIEKYYNSIIEKKKENN